MPLPKPGVAVLRDQRSRLHSKLRNQVIQVVVRLQDDVPSSDRHCRPAAARAALGPERLAQERHAAFTAVTRLREYLDLINEHKKNGEAVRLAC